ncbi:aminoglycoside phosphotransferase protein [Apiospora kogelbergensis]|uniref:aminoglycoside phosphotransferase protein n=1 Tax=Apiospora kogelbergensis TaxID=1337665 RepID=UPI0031304107
MSNASHDRRLPMPMTPEEISTNWLGSILGHKVQSFTTTSTILNQTTGKVFLDITYEDGAAGKDRPAHLCLKGSFNPVMANMPGYAEILYMAYSQEVEFFARVAPKLSTKALRLPKVWWAGASREQRQGICAMEDLNRRQGIRYGEPAQAAPLAEVLGCVEQLAALHGATWGFTRAHDMPSAGGYEAAILGMTLAWDAMVLDARRPPVPAAYRDQARTTAALRKHLATRNPRFRCLVHGDAHVGNLFADDDGPGFLDWQFASVGCAFHDVAYYVVGALSVADRRRHEDAVLEHYLAALARLGGPKLDWRGDEEVRREYRKCVLAGMGWVLTPEQMQRRERVHAMVERYAAALEDHKVIELIESLPDPDTAYASSDASLSSS